jgi:hypothetical protein
MEAWVECSAAPEEEEEEEEENGQLRAVGCNVRGVLGAEW